MKCVRTGYIDLLIPLPLKTTDTVQYLRLLRHALDEIWVGVIEDTGMRRSRVDGRLYHEGKGIGLRTYSSGRMSKFLLVIPITAAKVLSSSIHLTTRIGDHSDKERKR